MPRKYLASVGVVAILFLIVAINRHRPVYQKPQALETKPAAITKPDKKMLPVESTTAVPNEYIIKLDPTASEELERIIKNNDGIIDLKKNDLDLGTSDKLTLLFTKLNQLDVSFLQQLAFTIQDSAYIKINVNKNSKQTVKTVLETISALEGVVFIEPNYIYHTSAITDPYYLDQQSPVEERSLEPDKGGWKPDHDYQYGLKISSFDEALVASIKNDIVVAVIDTGVDYNHLELRNRMWKNPGEIADNNNDDDFNGYIDDDIGWNVVSTPENEPLDDHKHGTHVAGIIAADANGYGGVGVNPKALIMPLKVCGKEGLCPNAGIAEMIVYATREKAHVINLSLGSPSRSKTIEDAVDEALNNNVVVVAAAGNFGVSSPSFPAGITGVIAVSATNNTDKLANFSNFGEHIFVSAPGVDILSLRAGNILSNAVVGKKTDHLILSGTSMASPHVAGFASLILAKNPSLKNNEVANIIANGADDLGDKGFDEEYGFGRINIHKSLTEMNTRVPNKNLVHWELNTELRCPDGRKPWLPLPNGVYFSYEVERKENRENEYEWIVKSDQSQSFYEAQQQLFITTTGHNTVTRVLLNMELLGSRPPVLPPSGSPPHPAIRYGTDQNFVNGLYVEWDTEKLPDGKYPITFTPLSYLGWCDDQTWTVETKLVCKNGNTPEPHNTQILYTIWPDLPNSGYVWKFSEDDTTLKKQVNITTSVGLKNIYVGMWDSDGTLLTLTGESPSPKITYGTLVGNPKQPIAYWSGSKLLNYPKPVKLTFKAPESWCKNNLVTPQDRNSSVIKK